LRRIFFKVTTESRDVASRDANEFGSSHSLYAAYELETYGTGAPLEVIEGGSICGEVVRVLGTLMYDEIGGGGTLIP
jgi:hypothetical protein